jgi:ergothioneine biosynthesis protein EgtB
MTVLGKGPGQGHNLTDPAELAARYRIVRAWTESLCEPLQLEDYVVQSMPDASPAKWHLAHTTWFFETFVLEEYMPGFRPYHPQYRMLFNSYYEAVGPRFTRAERGLLTRPSVDEIEAYRCAIDEAMLDLLSRPDGTWQKLAQRVEVGLQHEQQHQELLLTDLQHAFSRNPLSPIYTARIQPTLQVAPEPQRFVGFEAGLSSIGYDDNGFAFDNERPRHRVFAEPFELASRLVTASEYLEFVQDGGYRRPELWLSEGWAAVQSEGLSAPLYWHEEDGSYRRYSLHGDVPVAAHEPVSHVSFYEADAYARWAGARLPTEAEWEIAYTDAPVIGHFAEQHHWVPEQTGSGFGSAWVWTASPYVAYPGFRPEGGAIGEYNGKFMCNQWVLRGGSCFSPQRHLRATYRNFFPAPARWQVTGIRLAR